MTHGEIVNIAYDWLNKKSSFCLKEITSMSNETPDVIGFKSGYSILIECKISRQDFLKDAKKLFRIYPDQGMGNYRYYCCPENLIQNNELPEKWGLLYVKNNRIKTIKNAINEKGGNIPSYENCFSANKNNEWKLMYSILRRINEKKNLHDGLLRDGCQDKDGRITI